MEKTWKKPGRSQLGTVTLAASTGKRLLWTLLGRQRAVSISAAGRYDQGNRI